MDKTIIVRVVEWTSLTNRNTLSEGPHPFGPAGGVQPAVQAAYPPFPAKCLQVNLVVPAFVPLWQDGSWLFSDADMYGAIQNENVVEVHVNGTSPSGPDWPGRPGWVSDGPGSVSLPWRNDDDSGPDDPMVIGALLTTLKTYI